MGYLHGAEEGQRRGNYNPCRHGKEGFCRRCAFPTAAEREADRRAAEEARKARLAAEEEKARRDAEEEAARKARIAEALAAMSPYDRAMYNKDWEQAYNLLPNPCWMHEQDPDGYPPPPKRVPKPDMGTFWEAMTEGWKYYHPSPKGYNRD